MPSVEKFKIDPVLVKQFVAPVAALLVVFLVYTLHLPGMHAASDIIDGYRATADPVERLEAFERAVNRNSFAQQEIAEQVAQQAMSIIRNEQVSEEVRMKYVELAVRELDRLAADKPGDARIHVFIGTFYRSLGDLERAKTEMARARELSPLKQSIISQQAIIEYSLGNVVGARDLFKEALDLDERNAEAREFYAAMLFTNGEGETAKALASTPEILSSFSKNDFLLSAVNQAEDYAFMVELYKEKVKNNPEVDQNWASLAFLYSQIGDKASAVATLREAAVVRPTFAKSANCIADNIDAGRQPQEGC